MQSIKIDTKTNGRESVATALLLFTIFCAPLFTTLGTSRTVNNKIAFFQIAFVLLLAPEVAHRARAIFRNSRTTKFIFFTSLTIIYSQFLFIEHSSPSRTLIYLTQPVFFLAATYWFSSNRLHKLTLLAAAQSLSTIVFGTTALTPHLLNPGDFHRLSSLDTELLVYRHIRHLNYDIASTVVLSTAALFALAKSKLLVASFLTTILIAGALTVLSGGRGSLMAIIFFFAGLTLAPGERRLAFFALLGFLTGCVLAGLVFPSAVDWMWQRTAASSLNSASSGRLSIWSDTIMTWLQCAPVNGWLLGCGPDSFRSLQIRPGFTHPHSSVAQALLEFGLAGLALLSALFSLAARYTARTISPRPDKPTQSLSLGLCAMLVFSLVDGLLYHGAPLLICVMLAAYLFAKHLERPFPSACSRHLKQPRCRCSR